MGKNGKNGKKGKNQQDSHDKRKDKRVKGQPQGKSTSKNGYMNTCSEFKFINEQKVRSVFENKLFMKAVSSNKPLGSREIKLLQKQYKDVNWHKPGPICLCLVCGQPLDERHVNEHISKNKNHFLMLSFNDHTIYCAKCDKDYPIQPKTLLSELLGMDEEVDPKQKLKPKVQAAGSINARGLHNLGNSCWLNASLQLLARLNLIPDNVSPTTNPLCYSFLDLCMELKKSGHAIKPSEFVSNMLSKLPFLSVIEQQDAYEFLVLFLDTLRDELGGTPQNLSSSELSLCQQSLSTPVDKCVGFILESSMKCENCNSIHCLYQRTTILSICVPIGTPSTLEECLKMYFSESSSAGDDWRCEDCGQIAECSITPSFATLPSVLIIHLSRFRFGNHGYVKNNVKISIPLSFETNGFGISSTFNLMGFVTHYGTMEGGHYTSVFRDKSNNYLYFDDSVVSTITQEEALDIQPYILFYTKQ